MKRKLISLLILMSFAVSYSGCSSSDNSEESLGGGGSGGYGGSPGGGSPSGDATENVNLLCEGDSCFYFSYDDSASTAAVELVKYYLENGMQPSTDWGRPFEFLNFEQFDPSSEQNIGLFDVSFGLWSHPDPDISSDDIWYELGVHVATPVITNEQRPNAVLTILVDVSGSMDTIDLDVPLVEEGTYNTRLDIVKYGLLQLSDASLKEGDIVNIVQFRTDATEADVLLEAWSYSESDDTYKNIVSALNAGGTTNLNAGIEVAYWVAIRNFDQTKTNRVVILTDAYANTGEVDPSVISENTRINNMEGIYFSGIGIGPVYNEAFLNELTEAGKGSYFAAISPNDIKKAFGERFVALLNVAARNTRFRLDYSSKLSHVTSASEEQSTDPNDVQTTNFSYNTSQYFLEGFKLNETDVLNETFKLTIEYELADGSAEVEEIEVTVDEILGEQESLVKDAYIITFLADLVSGEKSCLDFDAAKESILDGHSSAIALEYCDLIDAYCALSSQ